MKTCLPNICLFLLLPLFTRAQLTSGNLLGTVKTISGEWLQGAAIRLVHKPTNSVYLSQSSAKGNFAFNNLDPGGPYVLEVSFTGMEKIIRENIEVTLGNTLFFDLTCHPSTHTLKGITVVAGRQYAGQLIGGQIIGAETISQLPAAGRNLHELLRMVPEARQVNTEGGISMAGQNNRYNIFYVDGAIHNDAFGLSASGTNGGQTGIAPISVDAIAQLQVNLSPYDASIGNFTGGSIQAITKAGTNRTTGSVYHFISNDAFNGQYLPENETALKKINTRNRTSGIRFEQALIPNKVFLFTSYEAERNERATTYQLDTYQGTSKEPYLLNILAGHLQSVYHYDAGNLLNHTDYVFADRLAVRADWHLNNKHRISISKRLTLGQRIYTNKNSATDLHFGNDGYRLQNQTGAVSLEWKAVTGRRNANRLLLTYTRADDDRGPAGKAFPRVRINDGDGAIVFGTDNSSTLNRLIQKNWTVFNKFSFTAGKHFLGAGFDIEYQQIHNVFLQNSYGNYTYASLRDFYTNAHPSAYRLGFALSDSMHTLPAAAEFQVLKYAFFLNDEMRIGPRLLLQVGIRMDQYRFLTNPALNAFVNTTAIPAFSKYWDTEQARSGAVPVIPATFSPRMGFRYELTASQWVIHGGFGLFTGRIPLAWPGGLYLNNGAALGGYAAESAQLNKIRFRPDVNHQWTINETGGTLNKEPLNLMASAFHMPAVWRASMGIEKKWTNKWQIKTEIMFTKNIQEAAYRNLNLLSPTDTVSGPDNRLVYPLLNNGKISINPDGSNPYDYAILLSNRLGAKGYSGNIATTLSQQTKRGWFFQISHSYGRAYSAHDGAASVHASQWRFTESINGRNNLRVTESDYSPGHRIFAFSSRRYILKKNKTAFSISVCYDGHSGMPFSYVYASQSMTRDDGIYGTYDLMYIPTKAQLAEMIFLPDISNGNLFTPEQQKEALEMYIQHNPYLANRRGMYAERNGSRTPFTHRFDLKLKQEIFCRLGKQNLRVQITLDLFNLGNFINRNWGQQYTVPFGQAGLVDFAGYQNAGKLVPQYIFSPTRLNWVPWEANAGTQPEFSSVWSSQLGLRVTFD